MGSSRRNTTKGKNIGIDGSKKLPNTSRNESSKSTPSNNLLNSKRSSNHTKNMMSTGNMMTLKSHCIDRYLPFSSQSSVLVQQL